MGLVLRFPTFPLECGCDVISPCKKVICGAMHDMHIGQSYVDFRHIWATHIWEGFVWHHIWDCIFFSNNAFIKIDMNLHKNVIIPIFTTSFKKLQLDFTRILQKLLIFYIYLEHYIGTLSHTHPPFHRPTTLSVA